MKYGNFLGFIGKTLEKYQDFSWNLIFIVQGLPIAVILLAVLAGQVQLDNWEEHDT